MKKLFLLIACISSIQVFSQTFDTSGVFKETFNWTSLQMNESSSVILLKNNNTFLIEATGKMGIKFKIFDAKRNQIMYGKFNSQLIPDIRNWTSHLEGIYEINGDLIIFYLRTDNFIHKMIRIIIDGNNGNIKKEEIIAEVAEYNSEEINNIVKNSTFLDHSNFVINTGFYQNSLKISKDPNSDFYILVKKNSNSEIKENKLEILHFNPNHTIINKIKFANPSLGNGEYSLLNYYVHKDESIFISTYTHNYIENGGEEIKCYITQFKKDISFPTTKEIKINTDNFDKSSFDLKILYNKQKDIFHLFTCVQTEIKKYKYKFDVTFLNFTQSDFTFSKSIQPDFSTLNVMYKDKMERKKDYEGIIKNVIVNHNGDLELLYQTFSKNKGIFTLLGDIAYLKINSEGKTINSHAFSCEITSKSTTPFINYEMAFVSSNKSSYIFFNNYDKNFSLPENKTANIVNYPTHTNVIKYTINDNSSKKEYAYKVPVGEDDFNFFKYYTSDYNESLNTYVTILKTPNLKQTRLIWIKLD